MSRSLFRKGTGTAVRMRRKVLGCLAGLLLPVKSASANPTTRLSERAIANVDPRYRLRFPEDHGSHPRFRIEWWYVTGWLETAGAPLGFQITFFQTRPNLRQQNPSAFTPHHVLIGHAALSDPRHGRLLHDQRMARAGFGLAGAETGRTRVWISDWSLEQEGPRYRAAIRAREFELALELGTTATPLLHGRNGISRKGPKPEAASYYYSQPHLAVSGSIRRAGRVSAVSGRAWLDHEWSSSYLDEDAVGWDWTGLNLDDGSAVMAFRMRDAGGNAIWSGGTIRNPDGTRAYDPDAVRFEASRSWRSPRTGVTYPVAWRLACGELRIELEPLFDDQELDARSSTGTIYWEGAVRALRGGKPVGTGYLELTGYWRRLAI